MSAFDPKCYSEADLLRCFADILDELKRRGVVRTRNNPVADYAEWLVSQRLRLTLASGNTQGYDATGEDGSRYQIKTRRLDATNKSRQLSPIRNLQNAEFDYLVAVLFNRDFTVKEAYRIPHSAIEAHARFSPHVNGHILLVQGSLLTERGVREITTRLQS